MRHTNGGIRKICACPRRVWSRCAHPWHFNFKPKGGPSYRFSLDAHLNKHVDSKTDAEAEAAIIKAAIKAGTFGAAAPALDRLTVAQLLDIYNRRYLQVARAASATNLKYQMATVAATALTLPTGRVAPFGQWCVADVTTDAIEQFREARRPAGLAATNRDLSFLRAMFSWAIRLGYAQGTPFKRHGEPVVKLVREPARTRRLHDGEEAQLLAASSPHLRGLILAAIETGMRQGELLSLQWSQVEGLTVAGSTMSWAPRAEIVIPWAKAKTRRDRRIPISSRLRAVLEMNRLDPAGQPLPLGGYVFGSEVGTRVLGFARAWHRAILKSHGHTPTYTPTANLTPKSRAALAEVGLHFHDLRREAGSRWMDAGVPLAMIQRWLGHTNVAQTSTYLSGTPGSEHDAMARFDLQRLATDDETGGQTGPPTTEDRHETPNETAIGRVPAIM
jgi:integrase